MITRMEIIHLWPDLTRAERWGLYDLVLRGQMPAQDVLGGLRKKGLIKRKVVVASVSAFVSAMHDETQPFQPQPSEFQKLKHDLKALLLDGIRQQETGAAADFLEPLLTLLMRREAMVLLGAWCKNRDFVSNYLKVLAMVLSRLGDAPDNNLYERRKLLEYFLIDPEKSLRQAAVAGLRGLHDTDGDGLNHTQSPTEIGSF